MFSYNTNGEQLWQPRKERPWKVQRLNQRNLTEISAPALAGWATLGTLFFISSSYLLHPPHANRGSQVTVSERL